MSARTSLTVGTATLTNVSSVPGADATNTFAVTRGNSTFCITPSNVVIGSSIAPSIAGTSNVLVGCTTATVLANSSSNTILGNGAGVTLTTGGHNTIVGYAADAASGTASYGCCFGDSARIDSSSAVAFGYNSSALSQDSIAIGRLATVNASCPSGIAIGNNAIVGNGGTTPSYGIAIGYNTQCNHTNSVALGNGAVSLQANEFVIGNNNLKMRLTTIGSTEFVSVATFSGVHTLTAAEVNGGLVVGTAGGSVALTVPNATDLEALNPLASVGITLVLKVVVADANTYTLTGNTGVTIVGKTALLGINGFLLYFRKDTTGPAFKVYS